MVEERKKEILQHLQNDTVLKVFLVGESGVGKTWIARETSNSALSSGLSGFTIWLFRKKKMYDTSSICKDIARQFSLLSMKEKPGSDFEEADGSGPGLVSFCGSGSRPGSASVSAQQCMVDQVRKKLKEKILALADEHKKFILLILDDVPNEVNVDNIISKVRALFEESVEVTVKVLITQRDQESALALEESAKVVEIKPLPEGDSLTLFRSMLIKGVSDCRDFEKLAGEIVKKSRCLPGVLIATAQALNWIARGNSDTEILEMELQEAANDEDPTKGVNPLLQFCLERLPTSQVASCYWHGRELFRDCSAFHFSEVITHWILEGYLGQVESIDRAYAEGHRVLIELIDRCLMKTLDDNLITMEGLALALADNRDRGLCGESNLGMVRIIGDGESEGLGRIARTKGMAKTLSEQKSVEPVTLVLDRTQYTELAMGLNQEVQGISLFNPSFQSVPGSLSHAQNLLVLRESNCLNSITEIRNFKSLTVLEISGASSLEELPRDLFKQMVDIRSLNLSGTGIKTLPSSLSNLSKLRWLVLSNCSCLETLPSLKKFKELEVLNLNGANSLKRIHDLNFAPLEKLQFLDLSYTQIERLPFIHDSKSLIRLFLHGCSKLFRVPALPQSLQILDLSKASNLMEIFQLPLKQSDLRVLNLSGCSAIEKLPSTKTFKKLEYLHLSGAVALAEIEDESFEHLSGLKVLDLSETKVEKLPSLSGLGNLRKLLLRSCGSLRTLPGMKGLSRLEELEISGSSSLTKLDLEHLNHKNLRKLTLACCAHLIEIPSLKDLQKLEILDLWDCASLSVIQDSSFEHMSRLQRLDLSGTNIEELPSLLNLRNLRHLLLRNCANLKSLPGLESLTMLRDIDLCGACSLPDDVVWLESLKNMTHLEKLDLSGARVNELPSFASLTQLSLSGCSDFSKLPNLEELIQLKVLNLAGTAVKNLPFLESLVKLQELILRDCSGLEQLQSLSLLIRLEILDMWGTGIKEFPYWTQELNHLKRLHLPDLRRMGIDWGRIRRLPEELNWEECGILKVPGIITEESSDPSFVSIYGTEFFSYLERNPELWDTTFKRFHFLVFPSGEKHRDMHRYRDLLGFLDIHLKLRNLPPRREIDRLIEVHGTKNLSRDLQHVLRRAEHLCFSNISCLSCLSGLDVSAMKGCWIEKCDELEYVFDREENGLRLGRKLEILWVSNLQKLSSLYSDNMPLDSYQNLRKLYLDCCPRLERVFSPSQNPKSLEVLRVSFCDRLVNVFENEPEEEDRQLENSSLKLYLFELPMLKRTGVMIECLAWLEHSECPRLEGVQNQQSRLI
ncbi:putative disease resistance protein At4g19050 [Punica granatum]|uniref:Uncharacterized protein n=2 Tax=Punica granatum TaxID=22663 RepID=A0A218XU61_PUNGR|nr:putative disease resistance protein At4g19050 [Punica granatum]OWM88348.1 hypothetical protein CDL15_Pgr003760 [Punica granatum]PKI41527.1 hypothetical protein CRG98_038038 [Punica granatum]